MKGDTFFSKLNKEDQDFILNRENSGWKGSPGVTPSGLWYGAIQYCPTCKDTRITSCCACGCGNCYTCNYRWSCVTPENEYLLVRKESKGI